MVYDIWIGRSFLSKSALDKIEQRLQNITVPTGLGRLPTSVAIGLLNSGKTGPCISLYNVYMTYCLHNILSVGDTLS